MQRVTRPGRRLIAAAVVAVLALSLFLLLSGEWAPTMDQSTPQSPPVSNAVSPPDSTRPEPDGSASGESQPAPSDAQTGNLDGASADSLDPDTTLDAEGVLERGYYRSSPERWISHIERVLSEGRFEEAGREFEAFRAHHPAHPYAAE